MHNRLSLRRPFAAPALWVLVLAWSWLRTATAADDPQFRHLGIEDGLPSSQVTDVLRDRRGFMWVGTAHGVSRFDSHRFRNYSIGPGEGGSAEQVVRLLYEDEAGVIWAVTASSLNRYSPVRDAFDSFPARAMGAKATNAPELTSIAEDAGGRLIVGSSNGLLVVDRASGATTNYSLETRDGALSPAVNALHRDPTRRLWVGTDWGLFALNDKGGADHWVHVMGAKDDSDVVIRALATDQNGELWIGTGYAGIAKRDPRRGEFTRYRHSDDEGSPAGDRIARIIAERDGPGVWIAIENNGVDRFDPKDNRFEHVRNDPSNPYSLASDAVWSIYQDPAGLLWVGTFAAGLNISMPNGIAIRHYRSYPADAGSLSGNTVSGFLVDAARRTWVSTDGGGLNRFDAATGRFERFTTHNTNLNSDAVLSVAQARDGALWIATWAGGISRFDVATHRFTAYTTKNSGIPHDNVYEVLVDRAGDVWAGTDNGIVARLDAGRATFSKVFNVVPEGHKWSSVLVLRELSDGRLAAGLREGGLALVDPHTGAQEHYLLHGPGGAAISSNMVRTIHESSPGILWVGTDAGLDRIDLASTRVSHLGVEDGLSSRFVDGVLSDANGNLWISTDNGIDRFDPRTRRFRHFTRADGLQSNEFLMRAAYRAPDGTLLFGGSNGFNAIRPAQIVQPAAAPVVMLTDLLVFNKPVRPGEPQSPLPAALDSLTTLTVPYSQNVLTFQFTALEYSAPGSVRYAYRLKGFDADWQDARDQAEATYTNLSPGRYEFHVRASDIDGAWHDAAVPLELIIAPAFWQTWWFRIAAVLILGAALAWFWRFHYRRRLEIELSRRALFDPLTGLASRLLFDDRVTLALERQARMRTQDRIALMFIDLDRFKAVNDSMGHHAGDELLRIIAARLLECTRSCDTVSRHGGDEFAILLEDLTHPDNARQLASRIIEAIQRPVTVGEGADRREVGVSASIGIAFAEAGLSAIDFVKRADAAMYRAKMRGHGRVFIAGSSERGGGAGLTVVS